MATAQLEPLFAGAGMRSVFSSESVKVVQFGTGGPPGGTERAEGWRAVTRVLRSYVSALCNDSITTVFPDDCSLCNAPMTAWSVAPVCDMCLERVGPQEGILCSVCGEALGLESARFAAAMGSTVCTMCRMAPPDFARAVAYATYRDELREVLHMLKYSGRQRLAAGSLGRWLAEAIAGLAQETARELTVVAVPLFPARERIRGFNQSVLLAEGALTHLRKTHPQWKLRAAHHAMTRARDTDAQFGLNPQQRRRNLRGAFRVVQPELVRGREVLLVDDIMTTGSTARECARVLLRAGAAKVWVVTVARAQAEAAAGAFVSGGDVAMWTLQEPDAGRRQSFTSGA